METIYTLGRESLTFEKLSALLKEHSVQILLDVRAGEGEETEAAFRRDWLRTGIMNAGLTYHWAAMQLGGPRPALANSRNTALAAEHLRGFADYMETENCRCGIDKLLNLAQERLVIFGDAAEPEDCHRSLLADALVGKGARVLHILADGSLKEHEKNVLAREENGVLIYDG